MQPRLAPANPEAVRRSIPIGQLGPVHHPCSFLRQQWLRYPLLSQIVAKHFEVRGLGTSLHLRACHRDSSRGRGLGGNPPRVRGDQGYLWGTPPGCLRMLFGSSGSMEPRSCVPSRLRLRPHEVVRRAPAVAMVLLRGLVCRLRWECQIYQV